jgi:hypothetical protein
MNIDYMTNVRNIKNIEIRKRSYLCFLIDSIQNVDFSPYC